MNCCYQTYFSHIAIHLFEFQLQKQGFSSRQKPLSDNQAKDFIQQKISGMSFALITVQELWIWQTF